MGESYTMPHLDAGDLSRREALRQAVIYANAQAHAVRKSPEEVVAAAKAFESFLNPPADQA